jgi:hypothetical protein
MKIKTYNNPSTVGSLVEPNTKNWLLLLLLLFKNEQLKTNFISN